MSTETPSKQITVIRPTKGWVRIHLRELWEYRELLFFLIWRDAKVRYKQTVLGIGWAVIQPLLMALLFTVVFNQLANIQSRNVEFILFAYMGLLPWNLFAKGLTDGSRSLVTNERLVTKVYFPRLILPSAAVLAGLVDFVIGLGVGFGLLLYFGRLPTIAGLLLPLFVGLTAIAAMGIAFWLSAIDARYRDVRYTVPFLTQMWFFLTPILYPPELVLQRVPEAWRWLFSLNPMVGVVEGFRWALFGESWDLEPLWWLSVVAVVGIFVSGILYFRRTERIFADMV